MYDNDTFFEQMVRDLTMYYAEHKDALAAASSFPCIDYIFERATIFDFEKFACLVLYSPCSIEQIISYLNRDEKFTSINHLFEQFVELAAKASSYGEIDEKMDTICKLLEYLKPRATNVKEVAEEYYDDCRDKRLADILNVNKKKRGKETATTKTRTAKRKKK